MKYKFIISSLNTEKLINKLLLRFDIFYVIKSEQEISFCCKLKDKNKIKKILKKMGYKIKSEKYIGFLNNFKNILNIGALIGFVLSCALWFLSSFFITDVLILGNLPFTYNQIMQVLENNNINKWSLKSNVNITKLENELQSLKYVSYASAIIKGNALVINIKEQLTNSEVVSINQHLPLISYCDCKITSIKLIQGTLKVKVGDIVKTGDVLVEPFVINNGKKLSVQPLADIVADVWITMQNNVYKTKTEKVKTGNVITNYSISFMGIDLFKKDTKVDFLNYQTLQCEEYLTKSILPIKIKYFKYYEYVLQTTKTNFNENKQHFIEETRKTCLLNVKEYDIIKNESYVVYNYDDYDSIVYTITLNKKIC